MWQSPVAIRNLAKAYRLEPEDFERLVDGVMADLACDKKRAMEVLDEECRVIESRAGDIATWAESGPEGEYGPYRLRGWQRNLFERLGPVFARAADPDDKYIEIILIDAIQQSGKSSAIRRALAWFVAKYGLPVGFLSCNDNLAKEHTQGTKDVLRYEFATRAFPHLGDTPKDGQRKLKDAEHHFSVPNINPGRPPVQIQSAGRKAGLEGRPLAVVACDDLYSTIEDASSVANNRQVNGMLKSSALPRVQQFGGVIIDISTRKGATDSKAFWLGKAKELEAAGKTVRIQRWSYPLRGDEDFRYGSEGYLTEEWDQDKEDEQRILMGDDAVILLDGQDPADTAGLYRLRHFKHTYEEHPAVIARTCESTHISADCAETDGAGDWTVIQWWGIRGGVAFLLGQHRGQWGDHEVIDQINEARREWEPMGVLVEDTSSGKVANSVMRGKVPGLEPVKVSGQGSKRARIKGTLSLWAMGSVCVPSQDNANAPWWHEKCPKDRKTIRQRLLALRGATPKMTGEVDDEADAATNFLRWWVSSADSVDSAADWF